uniref:Nitric oxide synthase-interacting protein n=1 Tax=Sarcophilus harrisii TaxID=9305 RepID=A0A7N4PGJ5_SARHA
MAQKAPRSRGWGRASPRPPSLGTRYGAGGLGERNEEGNKWRMLVSRALPGAAEVGVQPRGGLYRRHRSLTSGCLLTQELLLCSWDRALLFTLGDPGPRMTRHGKNCTAGAVYTYHEKKKDTAASGYGTQNVRLSRDAVKDFDCCCLSLQPCHDPVVTPDGFLYEREAILEYILHQKREIARQMKAYEKQRGAQQEERRELSRAAAQDQLRGFLEKEAAIVSRPLNPFTPRTGAGPGPSSTPEAGDKDKAKELPSFWIPSLTPEAKASKLEKPGGRCDHGVCGAPDPQGHGGPHQRGSINRQGHHPAAEGERSPEPVAAALALLPLWPRPAPAPGSGHPSPPVTPRLSSSLGRHRLRRFWGAAGGQEVPPRDAGLKGPGGGGQQDCCGSSKWLIKVLASASPAPLPAPPKQPDSEK